MLRKNAALIITVLLFLAIAVGQLMTYVILPKYDADVIITESGAKYSVSTNSSISYNVLAYDNARPVDRLYVYYDESYATYGVTHAMQNTFIEQTTVELRLRGFKNIERVNAIELGDIVSGTHVPGDAILITSGVLPDTVYTDQRDDIFGWVNRGGTLYWAGFILGAKFAAGMELKDLEKDCNFDYQYEIFGEDECFLLEYRNSVEMSSDPNARMLGKALMLTTNAVQYGLRTDLPNTLSLGFEHRSKNGHVYSSISLLGYGSGMICVIGNTDPQTVYSISQMISSGVSNSSTLLSAVSGTLVRNNITDLLQWGTTSGKIGVQIRMGEPFLVYARTFFSES
jgi:hypothetical protein